VRAKTVIRTRKTVERPAIGAAKAMRLLKLAPAT
jgi:hypothetical protein